jgi:hypothetical protein
MEERAEVMGGENLRRRSVGSVIYDASSEWTTIKVAMHTRLSSVQGFQKNGI